MSPLNPRYVLHNYLVRRALGTAEIRVCSELHAFFEVLSEPYSDQPVYGRFAREPPGWGGALALSCSSRALL